MRGILIILLTLFATAAQADDRENYYYPPLTSEEVFDRDQTTILSNSNRAVRVLFTTQITKAQLSAPESPRFAIFAKGGEAQHMIIVALDDEVFRTLYRARAVLAQLTANSRGTDFFVKNGITVSATWLDLAKLLGFEDIVLSNGQDWSHRIVIE